MEEGEAIGQKDDMKKQKRMDRKQRWKEKTLRRQMKLMMMICSEH